MLRNRRVTGPLNGNTTTTTTGGGSSFPDSQIIGYPTIAPSPSQTPGGGFGYGNFDTPLGPIGTLPVSRLATATPFNSQPLSRYPGA
jgi:hypothetical protein